MPDRQDEPPTSSVHAAGAVLWRPAAGTAAATEVAVVHRPRYDDWSLPKGKVERGETEPVTAVRELREETGYLAHLGRRLHAVSYPIDGTTKHVRYWVARAVDDQGFTPGHEVDGLRWLSPPDAIELLTYPTDRKVVRRFTKRPADTRTLLIVRHGKAGRKTRYRGNDRNRPLDKQGRAQADSLTALLLAFGASNLHAADRVRCHQTIEPLARELSVGIDNEPVLTEEAYADNPESAHRRVLEISELPGTRVICTQGKVIPNLLRWWCERDDVRPDRSRNRKGSIWVLSLAGQRLIAADHIDSPLAPRR